MANVFDMEWQDEVQKQTVRQAVEFGNFDGDILKAQRVIDQLWPSSYPHRKNVRVLSIHGSGEVKKVSIPK